MRSIVNFRTSSIVGAALFALMTSLSCSLRAADNLMPPLNATPSQVHLPGKFEWADLFTDNPESEAKFYTQLFGWTSETTTRKGHVYILISNGGDSIAGIVPSSVKHAEDTIPRWVGFAATDDIGKAIKSLNEAGGKTLAKPREIKNRGTLAIAQDAQGSVFGLIQSSSGDVPDYQPAVGELAWAELFSDNPKSAAEFYSRTFQYESSVDSAHNDNSHLILATGEFARAGISSSPPWEGGKSDWLLFFCVSDANATANKAAQLGGTVLVSPHESKHGGQVAVIADPLGCVFGVLELETANTLKSAATTP